MGHFYDDRQHLADHHNLKSPNWGGGRMPNLEEASRDPIMVLHQMAAPSTNLIFQKDKTEFIFPDKIEPAFPYGSVFIFPDTKELIFPDCRSEIPCFSALCVYNYGFTSNGGGDPETAGKSDFGRR